MKNAESVLMHHLSSFQENDLESVMSDYTNESVLITADATYTGLKEISNFFTDLIPHFPKQQSILEIKKMVVQDGLAFIVWQAKTPSLYVSFGSDTFFIKKGKIFQQTFVCQMEYIPQ